MKPFLTWTLFPSYAIAVIAVVAFYLFYFLILETWHQLKVREMDGVVVFVAACLIVYFMLIMVGHYAK